MGKSFTDTLPEDLVHFYKSLRKSQCSKKWDWRKLLSLIQPGNHHASAFFGICESGVYHLMYSKPATQASSIACKKTHICDVSELQLAGACLARLTFTGVASKRSDKFRDSMQQIIHSLLDSLITVLDLSNFPATAIKSIQEIQPSSSHNLPRLISIQSSELNPQSSMELALCRIDLLSSTLRSIFEAGTCNIMPICVPYICSAISTTLSINVCDARHSSPALIACVRRLFNCFSVILTSCGVNIAPACSSIMTSLAYQLEWSSQAVRSESSLMYKLSVYRCTSSLLDTPAHVSPSVLMRIMPKIIKETCSDISNIDSTQSSFTSTDTSRIFELIVCCAVASLRIIEQILLNYSYVLSNLISECLSNAHEESYRYKIKELFVSLSYELENLAIRIVSQRSECVPFKPVFLNPLLLIQVVNVMSAVHDYEFLFPRSNTFSVLSRSLLNHEDAVVRDHAQRCFGPNLRINTDKSSAAVVHYDNLTGSSFTQTEQLEYLNAATETDFPNSFTFENPIELQSVASFESTPQAISKEKTSYKRVHFEEDSVPMKKPCPSVASTHPISELVDTEAPDPPKSMADPAMNEPSTSILDALCTFDDTLL